MSDISSNSLRSFAAELSAALDALDRAATADANADAAERRRKAANEEFHAIQEQVAKVRADTAAHLHARMTEAADAEKKSAAALVEHKRKHDAIAETSRQQLEDADGVRSRLNSEIAELRKQKDSLTAEVAQLRAKISDLASI